MEKISYRVKKSIKAHPKGFPLNQSSFHSAHLKANQVEKRAYPKGFKVLKKIDRHIPNNELLGHSTKKGKIEVSARVPKKYRAEVALHEKVENKILCKKCHKKNCSCH